MKAENFIIFILTHGRVNNIITLKTLKESGYTGPVCLVVDNEDKCRTEYLNKYGKDMVYIFDKKYYADQIDEGNNFDNRRTTTHARNACFDIAEELGYKYFMQLDDDYSSFEHRYILGQKLKVLKITNFDAIIKLYLKFYESTSFSAIAFAQGGDFIGGAGNPYAQRKPLLRKCMNSFICSTARRFWFFSQLNEDVNTYIMLGSRGHLFGTIPHISLVQKQTQGQSGGMTEAYLKYGTYCKSFTTVMMHPSSVQVSMMSTNHSRLHHLINWKDTVPVIIDEKYKKHNQTEL